MYNYFMFVGRLAKEPNIVNFADGKKVVNITLAVSRSFKNSKGEIETDFFQIAFWDFLVDYVIENIKVGMGLVIKGRIQTTPRELANGYILETPTLIGEKLMFFESLNLQANLEEEKNEE